MSRSLNVQSQANALEDITRQKHDGYYSAVAEGLVRVPQDGVWFFRANYPEVWIDGQKVVDNTDHWVLDGLRGDTHKDSLRRIDQIDQKIEKNAERRQTLTTLMTRGYLEPALFTQESNELAAEADALAEEKQQLVNEIKGILHQTDALSDLIQYAGHAEPSETFDEELVSRFLDRATIRTRSEIVFHLKCGLSLTERIGK